MLCTPQFLPRTARKESNVLKLHTRYSTEKLNHTIYTRNNMGQECEGNCGLWVLNEILKKTYPENLKKIVGEV